MEEAEKSYKKVVELAPHVYQARLQLSLIIHKLGRAEDALNTLDQDEQQEILNPHLMLERCQMLLAENKIDEFLYKGRILFSRHFVTIRNKDELHAISSAKKMAAKSKALVGKFLNVNFLLYILKLLSFIQRSETLDVSL